MHPIPSSGIVEAPFGKWQCCSQQISCALLRSSREVTPEGLPGPDGSALRVGCKIRRHCPETGASGVTCRRSATCWKSTPTGPSPRRATAALVHECLGLSGRAGRHPPRSPRHDRDRDRTGRDWLPRTWRDPGKCCGVPPIAGACPPPTIIQNATDEREAWHSVASYLNLIQTDGRHPVKEVWRQKPEVSLQSVDIRGH